jgi:hypothetical protein
MPTAALAGKLARTFLGLGLGLAATGCGNGPATASIKATWVLIAETDPDPMTAKPHPCSDFGATTVRFEVTPGGSFDFACDSYHGETPSFMAGYYGVQVIVFGPFGKVLETLEFPQTYAYGPTKLGEPLRFRIR